MNPGELSSEKDRCARAGGSSRREFFAQTISGGALLAATTVLGNELRSPEMGFMTFFFERRLNWSKRRF